MCSCYRYIAIDLKSFYASVECQDRGLNPLATNLVVADVSRTEKTICLAVSPSLKAYGIGGRARLFEVVQKVRDINEGRLYRLQTGVATSAGDVVRPCLPRVGVSAESQNSQTFYRPHRPFDHDCTGYDLGYQRVTHDSAFRGASFYDDEVAADPTLALDYLIAKPRMAKYIEVSAQIYDVYLSYFAPEDIHVYSIDEVFIDIAQYARLYGMDAPALASRVITEIYQKTGITATAGVGTNLYLAKVAMDILAKREEPDANGVRMAILDERAYKERLWDHEPLTDFWRVGKGYAKKLEAHGLFTMGDVARCSLGKPGQRLNEDLLFKLFGKNAELLIDHAWGYEPVGMQDIKDYKPSVNCKASGQVLQCAYTAADTRTVVWEMADQLALDLMADGLVTNKLTLTIGYDRASLDDPYMRAAFTGELKEDHYGRVVPKHAHGTINLPAYTALSHDLTQAATELFERIIDPHLLVKRVTISAEHVISETEAHEIERHAQHSLFDFLDDEAVDALGDTEAASPATMARGAGSTRSADAARDKQLQSALLEVRNKFGKNAVMHAVSLKEEGTARERNAQIGGHSA